MASITPSTVLSATLRENSPAVIGLFRISARTAAIGGATARCETAVPTFCRASSLTRQARRTRCFVSGFAFVLAVGVTAFITT